MTTATLMVHLELGQNHADLLAVGADLARRFHAHVIGIAACQPMPLMLDGSYLDGSTLEQFRAEMEREMASAEASFRTAMAPHADSVAWRSARTYGVLLDFIAEQARSADLVITRASGGDALDTSRAINTGTLLMQAGRPVLIVPTAPRRLQLERVLVTWKDTRESRRAVADAVPLLKRATHVVVAEVAAATRIEAAAASVHDVAEWLRRHGVPSVEPMARAGEGDNALTLHTIADECAADLIVAGAYGHSRLREWVLGGVTRDLLLHSERCTLVSH